MEQNRGNEGEKTNVFVWLAVHFLPIGAESGRPGSVFL